jgi:hypothetical protein
MFHASRSHGQNVGVLELHTVHAVLLNPELNEMLGFTNTDLNTLTGNPVNTGCFEDKIILDGPKETGGLPKWEAYNFDDTSH